jgi:PRTRC genetic system ParB family protein
MPGSCGTVTASLCFDAACNSQKVAQWRRARRGARQQPARADEIATTAEVGCRSAGKPAPSIAASGNGSRKPSPRPANQTPQRVVEYRIAQWRRWLAAALMAQPHRSHRVLIALTLAGRGSDMKAAQFEKALARIAGPGRSSHADLREALRRIGDVAADQVDRLVLAAIASAAFGIDTENLELLLDYLDVDEAQCFRWDANFLDLFTMSELASLATEVGLRAAMGSRFKAARAGKKDSFVQALLNVEGFAYQGTVPDVMRYRRQASSSAADGRDDREGSAQPDGRNEPEGVPEPMAVG